MSRIGQVICGYRLERALATGGFGMIYLAKPEDGKQKVAIKVMNEEYTLQPDVMRQLENEAQILSQLQHDHIVAFRDYWRNADGVYLALRWLKGGDLRQHMNHNHLTLEDISRILYQIASALDYAHHHHIVHRDMKPDNILLDESGNAFLADFGIAVDLKQPQVHDEGKVLLGSPAYIAPEQLVDKTVVPQGDIYSLGIMLFELLTGELPFKGMNSHQLLLMQVFESLPILPPRLNLPAELNIVLQKATDKNPENRYSSALELARDFEAAVRGFTHYHNQYDEVSDMVATQQMAS